MIKSEGSLDSETLSIKWEDICKPGAIVILFYDNFTSAKRYFVSIKNYNELEETIITGTNSNGFLPDNLQIGMQFVAQISIYNGAVRFPVTLVSINSVTNEYVFKLPTKNVLIKHHNSLRISVLVTGTFYNITGETVLKLDKPVKGNLSNTGLRLLLDDCPFRIRGRYFIALVFKESEEQSMDEAFVLKCKWTVNRIREFIYQSQQKYEVAGFFVYEDAIRQKLEQYISKSSNQ